MHAARKSMAKGFTLVEILIVVVILGILAAIVVPQFTNAANESRVGNVATQVSTIESQLELYAARNNGTYPTVADLNAAAANGDAGWSVMLDESYLKELPRNPFDNAFAVTAWDSTGISEQAVIYDGTGGWLYDEDTGNIAASAPVAADPDA